MVLLNYISTDNLLRIGLDEIEHAFFFMPTGWVLAYWHYFTKGVIQGLQITLISYQPSSAQERD